MATGTNPRYVEELRIGGGYGDSADGGADFEKDGDIATNGNLVVDGDVAVGLSEAADHRVTVTAGASNTAGIELNQANASNGASLRFSGADGKLTLGTRNGSTSPVNALEVVKGSSNLRVNGALGVGADPAGAALAVQSSPVTRSVTSVTRSSSTATVVANSHGFANGSYVTLSGATQQEYNGTFAITLVDANTFTVVVPGSPVTPATGTIQAKSATAVRIDETGSVGPLVVLPNTSFSYLNPGTTSVGASIASRQNGHLSVDVAGNDARDAFAVRTNSGTSGAALNAIPFVVNCANRVGINTNDPAEALDVNGNIRLTGDITVRGGDVVAGVQTSMRGIVAALNGAGGNTPGCIKLASPNGTIWYVFVEDDGTLKVHNALPTQNADGAVVGTQY
ncbi:MAG: hypothetical protein K1Y02_17420 [Candidatus Hydrogenedentes bacterium]|nr:hypothetical protein [Candidatus Hydrogenedentota bacterium]